MNNTEINNNPKVSVIVPLYNAEDYLNKCLTSLINQTFSDIEIICIDDGSTDDSMKILKEFAENDERIIIVKKEHSNAGEARNEGLRIARGQYLAFTDADDFAEPDMIERAYKTAEKQSADIVWFRSRMYDHFLSEYADCPWTLRPHEMPANRPFSASEASEKIFNMGSCTPWDKLFKSSFIFDNGITFQSVTTSNDMVFTFGALSLANRITTIEDILYNQRVNHLKVLSTNVYNTTLNYYKALSGLKEFLIGHGVYESFEKSFKNWAVDFSLWSYNNFKEPFHQLIGQRLRNQQFVGLDIYKMSRSDFYNEDHFRQVGELYKKYKREKNRAKSDKPLVSVIVPAYNSEDALEQILNSLYAQTLTDIEIICIDDASKDSSSDILSKYAKNHKDIKVIKNDEFKGYGHSINKGIAAAKSDYITIVNPFDLIDEKMLEILYKKARKYKMEIVRSDVCRITYDREKYAVINSMMSYHYEEDCDRLIDGRYERVWKDYCKIPGGTLFDKRFLIANGIYLDKEKDASAADEDFLFRAQINAERLMCIEDRLYYDIVKSCIFSGYSRMDLL